MSSLIGKQLQGGKYKLEAVLGRGGFGLTFRAHQNYLDQRVVIKTLNESFWSALNLAELQKQFQDEARRLALCSHPNVVRVSDFFIEDQLPYMVMDYIPGRSLYDRVLPANRSANPLSEPVAVRYIAQIAKALQAVHSKGLLHRDVKPQNIMIHQLTGEAVLIDFGIARELTQNPNKTHTSIVSEGYAPIEQYLPKAQRSAATDIYGLASTLYTLLTGEIPVAAVLRDRTPMPSAQQLRPDVSPAVADAIASGMQIELKDRPQSVNRWVNLLSVGQVSPAPVSPGQEPSDLLSSRQTGAFGRTQRPNSATQSPAVPLAKAPASLSEFPTKVVSPAYQSMPMAADGKTVAMPLPDASDTSVVGDVGDVAAPPRVKEKGCGCVSVLVSVAIAGIAAFSGFWLVSQFGNSSGPSLPETGAPELEVPTADVDPADVEPTDEADELEEDESVDEKPDKVPKKEKPEEQPEVVEPSDVVDTANAQLPLVLNDTGNPANDRPGDLDRSVVIPGFSPGDSADQIRSRLGAPTQDSTVDGFYTSVYELVPNRVSLAYTYEQGSTQVSQSEATFSPGTDFLKMRTAVSGMVNGASADVVDGLRAVRAGERDRYEFTRRGLSGVIERNAYGYVHVYVR
ncbi:MAG: serine/threonine-protein kinase [Cyanobacteria bacterium J06576_12]